MRRVSHGIEYNALVALCTGMVVFTALSTPMENTTLGTQTGKNETKAGPHTALQNLPAATGQISRLADMKPATVWPAHGKVTDEFGAFQSFRSSMGLGVHTGIDIANVAGTEIHAFKAGMVVSASNSTVDGCGRHVKIDHGDGLVSLYCHMSNATARSGQVVEAGAKIGEMGSTGASTGSHVHFAISVEERFVNPRTIMPGNPSP